MQGSAISLARSAEHPDIEVDLETPLSQNTSSYGMQNPKSRAKFFKSDAFGVIF